MTTIIAGSPAQFTVTVQANGAPVPISGNVSARVFTMDGRTELVSSQALEPDATGANWPAGVVAVEFDAAATGTLDPGEAMLVLQGDFGIKRFRLVVETLFEPTRTSLFIKDIVVDELRNDRLMAAAAGVLQDIRVSDQYLWDKIRAAESELAHTLRVPLVPTRFFPRQPTPEQIEALNGMAWEIEVGSDYDPRMWEGDKWGFIVTRQRPIIAINNMEWRYPGGIGIMKVPEQWITYDARYGHVRIVPTVSAAFTGLVGMTLMAGVSAKIIPSMVEVEYTAGLTDVVNTYPELLDCIKKMAVLKVVGDAYLPQSGSISGDGLSESISVDMGKYHDAIDHIINGPEGSNGGLMSKIHGIRVMVM
jgi:hypothetical protein